MDSATVGASSSTFLIYGITLVAVIWCIVDVIRRPSGELPRGKKAVWILASSLGWLLFGIVGGAIAAFYLVGPRRRLNAQRSQ